MLVACRCDPNVLDGEPTSDEELALTGRSKRVVTHHKDVLDLI